MHLSATVSIKADNLCPCGYSLYDATRKLIEQHQNIQTNQWQIDGSTLTPGFKSKWKRLRGK
ncbi:MAG: hypothetical protein NTX03_01750 [Bacteroidetes bacterium]|nr:hypothetical protein [Bacteroidota bacterium]